MPERTSYRQGMHCWVDLCTPDLEGAQRFYGALLGWTYEGTGEASGHYTLCLRDGVPVAGLGPQPDASVPSMWSTYLASDDVDGTAARITKAGGQLLMPPMDIFGDGRMAYAADPTGATFGVWQGRGRRGAGVVGEAGTFAWNELHTPDGAAADGFYGAVFGYASEQIGDGRNFDYVTYRVGDEVAGGRLRVGSQDARSHWMTYLAVADTDAAAAAVAAAGGKVVREAVDSPYGRLAVVEDPWGAAFTVMRLPG
ncbi:MAG TPA: VOC family protein [Mycobacteriales bacterium]